MTFNPFGIKETQEQPHEQAVYGLALLYNIIHSKIADFLSPYNLTPGKFNILMVIKHRSLDQGIKQVDISNQLILTPSNMTKMIDKLEKEGLVTRSALAGDRRVNLIRITKKGSQLLDAVWDGYQNVLKEAAGPLDKKKHKDLSKLLNEWFGNLQ